MINVDFAVRYTSRAKCSFTYIYTTITLNLSRVNSNMLFRLIHECFVWKNCCDTRKVHQLPSSLLVQLAHNWKIRPPTVNTYCTVVTNVPDRKNKIPVTTQSKYTGNRSWNIKDSSRREKHRGRAMNWATPSSGATVRMNSQTVQPSKVAIRTWMLIHYHRA